MKTSIIRQICIIAYKVLAYVIAFSGFILLFAVTDSFLIKAVSIVIAFALLKIGDDLLSLIEAKEKEGK